ncbi:WYL domain-containing protein [Ramlibacter sp. G-1-2-2]|uniref:WYL domain-containing protein n=1 Tax=Ramlibacter agri TaxID=2728837 RepID=A0A848H184_9BURK|nr:WYL domain-containing protein [Ramlibacter agri]NML42503.1 WYL domain-containing protein [Ramlibacter agri]
MTTGTRRGQARTRARPASLETLAFTLELLKRIPRNRKVTARELWQQLQDAGWQRDLRTVQRQLDELSGHFDIERDDRERPYGYRWKDLARGLSVPGLTEPESLVLALAERQLQTLLPAEVMQSMQPFFAQARDKLLLDARQAPAGEWMDKVRVVSSTQPLLPPDIRPGVFGAVSRALYFNHKLDVEYENSAGHIVRSSVLPLGLAQQGERLYLVCRFGGFNDNRQLALHRMHKVQDTGLPFPRPADFDLARYEGEGGFAFSQDESIELEIRIRKGAGLHLLESRLSDDQQAWEEGDCYRLRATVLSTLRLTWWLRGFGEDVTVLAPEALAAAVHPHRMQVAA